MNIYLNEIPLTDAERHTAEANHYLVLAFMERNELAMSEYYDALIFRYLNAIRHYHREAVHTMDIVTSVNRMLATALRDILKKQAERDKYRQNASLDAVITGGFTLHDMIPSGERGVCEQCIDCQEAESILSVLPEHLRRILRLRADGYSSREISRETGIPRCQMSSLLSEMQALASFWL